jgi:hypothetical protein
MGIVLGAWFLFLGAMALFNKGVGQANRGIPRVVVRIFSVFCLLLGLAAVGRDSAFFPPPFS